MDQHDRRRILWLASYPKSGNTWIRHFLNCYLTGFPADINTPFQFITGDLNAAFFQLSSSIPLTEMTGPEQVYYTPGVLVNYLRNTTMPSVGLKTHHAKVTLDGIPLIPPPLSRRAVYVIRDPRDVVISYANHCGFGLDRAIDSMCAEHTALRNERSNLFHYLSSWGRHVRSWTTDNDNIPYGVVRYEDMLGDHDKAFRKILTTFGLGFDEARFQYATEQTSFQVLQSQEQESGFKEKGKGESFFRKGKSGQWKESLTAAQIDRLVSEFRDILLEFGYL